MAQLLNFDIVNDSFPIFPILFTEVAVLKIGSTRTPPPIKIEKKSFADKTQHLDKLHLAYGVHMVNKTTSRIFHIKYLDC